MPHLSSPGICLDVCAGRREHQVCVHGHAQDITVMNITCNSESMSEYEWKGEWLRGIGEREE